MKMKKTVAIWLSALLAVCAQAQSPQTYPQTLGDYLPQTAQTLEWYAVGVYLSPYAPYYLDDGIGADGKPDGQGLKSKWATAKVMLNAAAQDYHLPLVEKQSFRLEGALARLRAVRVKAIADYPVTGWTCRNNISNPSIAWLFDDKVLVIMTTSGLRNLDGLPDDYAVRLCVEKDGQSRQLEARTADVRHAAQYLEFLSSHTSQPK